MVVYALATTVLLWKWPRMAVALILAFLGLLRPAEIIGLRRQDLVLRTETRRRTLGEKRTRTSVAPNSCTYVSSMRKDFHLPRHLQPRQVFIPAAASR